MQRLALILVCLVGLTGATPPRRILSSNLCADRLVLALADPGTVISVSKYGADPLMSTVVEQAVGLPRNRGDAEQIAALHPDLVVMGRYSSKAAAAMLSGLGIPVYRLPVPDDLAQMRRMIQDLAALLGVPDRGAAMIDGIDRGLAGLARPHGKLRAALYTAGGWTYGAGSIADDLLQSLGISNIARDIGIKGGGSLSLEALVASHPQMIITETAGPSQPSLAAQLLDNPLLSGPPLIRVAMPMKLWACADPALIDAARLIDRAIP